MTAPSIIIRLALEASPVVFEDYLHDGEELRMEDWLDVHPEYRDLIDWALELAERERAA